jgi:hypothetical protein
MRDQGTKSPRAGTGWKGARVDASELTQRLEALVEAQVAREQGRRPRDAEWDGLDDQQLAQQVDATCAQLGIEEGDDKTSLLTALRKESLMASAPAAKRKRRRPITRAQDVAGVLHFRSITSWFGVYLGVLVVLVLAGMNPLMVLPALVLPCLAYLRGKLPVQRCDVDKNGSITLIRGNSRRLFDVTHYPYIRMYTAWSGAMGVSYLSSMLVLRRDAPLSFPSWLGCHLFPRVTDECVVLFFNCWWDADRCYIPGGVLGQVFHRACVRAGHRPKQIDRKLFRGPGWEVHP